MRIGSQLMDALTRAEAQLAPRCDAGADGDTAQALQEEIDGTLSQIDGLFCELGTLKKLLTRIRSADCAGTERWYAHESRPLVLLC